MFERCPDCGDGVGHLGIGSPVCPVCDGAGYIPADLRARREELIRVIDQAAMVTGQSFDCKRMLYTDDVNADVIADAVIGVLSAPPDAEGG